MHPYPPPPPPPARSKMPLILAIVGAVVVAVFIAVVAWKATSTAKKYERYAKKARMSEAELNLKNLEKAAKAYYVEHVQFPVGTAAATPATSCCHSGRSDKKCEPDLATWDASEVWQQLDFYVDEPHYFRYAYESDGQRLTARAIGDLDCDDTTAEYVLEGTIVDGSPRFTLTPPERQD